MKTETEFATAAAFRQSAQEAAGSPEMNAALPWAAWARTRLADEEADYVALLDPATFGVALADGLDEYVRGGDPVEVLDSLLSVLGDALPPQDPGRDPARSSSEE